MGEQKKILKVKIYILAKNIVCTVQEIGAKDFTLISNTQRLLPPTSERLQRENGGMPYSEAMASR